MMLPRVIMSNAISADGRIGGFAADLGLYYGITGQYGAGAHLIGSNTVLASGLVGGENAAELPPVPANEDPEDRRAYLVAPDSRGRVRNWHVIRQQPYWRDVIVLCARSTPRSYLDHLDRTQVRHISAGDSRVDLREALEQLHACYGVEVVHLDSGGILNGAMLRAGLVDELHLLVHPEFVGGAAPSTVFQEEGPMDPGRTIKLRLLGTDTLDAGIVLLKYEVMKP